jgi:hypothetical protein
MFHPRGKKSKIIKSMKSNGGKDDDDASVIGHGNKIIKGMKNNGGEDDDDASVIGHGKE